MRTVIHLICAAILFFSPPFAQAADLSGEMLSLVWCVPFVGLLLSIALVPTLTPQLWHHHYGKITCTWVLLFLLPFAISFGILPARDVLIHALLTEYIPFILLLLSLFIVSGGIVLKGQLKGTPQLNVLLLFIGTALASFMGTTGAAMLLIRPVIKANQFRKNKKHTIIFFIFLVANIGGGLSPLGDPPLFLGFLNGVNFFWVTRHLFFPVILCSIFLLGLYYLIDSRYYKREVPNKSETQHLGDGKLRCCGKRNLVLLLGIIGSVLLSGFWKSPISVTLLSISVGLPDLVRDGLLIFICITSQVITPIQIRNNNQFTWEPIVEVAKLFAGIFITIFPVLTILKSGSNGALAPVTSLVSQQGMPVNSMYFWLTGVLSAFLDNAPTYLVFFNLANGNAETLMGPLSQTLLAISMGSVFMGALSYIGNAPNFMIKSIAAQNNIMMPSFFGYMKWSTIILLPIFLLLTWIFF